MNRNQMTEALLRRKCQLLERRARGNDERVGNGVQTWGSGERIRSRGSRAASSEHGRKTMPFSCRNLATYPPFNSVQRRSSMEIRAQQIDWSAAVSGEPHEAAAAARSSLGGKCYKMAGSGEPKTA